MNYDLAVIIPARSEMFLSRTVENILKNKRGKTEVIVGLDGEWSDPPLEDHPDLTVLYYSESIGQRAITNQCVKLSKAKYVMKIDGHCVVDEGFDVKMMSEMKDNYTMIPVLYNLYGFDWVCPDGHKRYQSPSGPCKECGKPTTRDIIFKPRMSRRTEAWRFDTTLHFQYAGVLSKRPEIIRGVTEGYKLSFNSQSVSSEIISFFTNLTSSHTFFINTDYSGFRKDMTVNAVCFSPIDNSKSIRTIKILIIGDKFEMLGVTTGSVFTKMVNYGDIFSSSSWNITNQPSIEKSMNHLMMTTIPDVPISMSINSSSPIPTSSEFINPNIIKEINNIFRRKFIYSENADSFHNGSVTLIPIYNKGITETMSAQGSCFMLTREKYWELNICDEAHGSWGQQGTEVACKTWLSGGRLVTNRKTWYSHLFRTQGADFGFPYPQSGKQVENARKYSRKLFMENTWKGQIHPLSWLIEKFRPLNNGVKNGVPDWHDTEGSKVLEYVNKKGKEFELANSKLTKAILVPTDNELDDSLAIPCQKHLLKMGLPIYNVSLKPMNFGTNIVLNEKRGYLTLFKQILAGLKACKEDIVFLCDHDILYHQSHFNFTPPKKDVFYYDYNVWKVRLDDGLATHFDAWQAGMMCGYRELLIEDYIKRVEWVEKNGWSTKLGFEPGTQKPQDRINDYKAEIWWSKYPSLDIKHGKNLTRVKWYPKDFRNGIRSCPNWMTSDSVKGWGLVKGNIKNILASIY